jgi:hypothetical protein
MGEGTHRADIGDRSRADALAADRDLVGEVAVELFVCDQRSLDGSDVFDLELAFFGAHPRRPLLPMRVCRDDQVSLALSQPAAP